jgi:hypothetical protein
MPPRLFLPLPISVRQVSSPGGRGGGVGHAADVFLLVIEAAKDDLGGSIEIALEDADIARRAGLEVRERVCKTNAAEAAFELGRWDLVDSMSREMLARDFSGMTLAFAHRIAGALACARGELAVAAAHLAAQRDAVGATATEYGAIEAEAELALWDGRPGAALAAAEAGLRIEAEDQLRWVLLAALGARAAADLAELARARGDDAAEAAARERASALREGARERAGDAAHPGPGRDGRSRARARRRRQRPDAVGRGRAPGRRGRGRSRPPTPAGATPRRRWRGATAPRPSRRCAPHTPPRPVSARARCRQRSKPWPAARASSYRPPRRSQPPASHRRPGRTSGSPPASSRPCSTSRAARPTAR